MNRVSSPDGVKKLIEELWLRHQSGKPLNDSNIFFVDLPEPTEEERVQMRCNRAERVVGNLTINPSDLNEAVDKLGGW